MVDRITDIHMHIVPDIDDGSESITMSSEMLKSAYEQGVRSVFCTSHSWWKTEYERDFYLSQLNRLREHLAAEDLDIELYFGNEILCDNANIEKKLNQLNNGILFSLNGTRYVLTEFDTRVKADETRYVLQKLIAEGWIPVIAHAERCRKLTVSDFVGIADMGCLIQINAYSLVKEHNADTKDKARELLSGRLVSFIGSDAHRTDHRPPNYTSGVQYILDCCETDYAQAVLYKNAEKLLK